MLSRVAALAACLACAGAGAAQAEASLSLDDAMARVAEAHPELRLFDSRVALAQRERDRAALRPGLNVGAELENFGGSGAASGVDEADLTLSLASTFERGGKLDARRAVADARIDALAVERESRRLDLLAEVARRYLAVVEAASMRSIAVVEREQRARTVDAARRRLTAGASPESVVLTAEAARARADLAVARTEHQIDASSRRLAVLWAEREPSFRVDAPEFQALPDLVTLGELEAMLDATPELAAFASEQRLREARVELARTQATPDVDWQAGVRRLGETDDVGFVGSISIPWGSRERAEPEIAAAEARLGALAIERDAKVHMLYATLVEAHGRYGVAALEVQRLSDVVVPALERAEKATARAFDAGASSFLEWSAVQAELTEARRQLIASALDGYRALIEIQRLTGQPMLGASLEAEATP